MGPFGYLKHTKGFSMFINATTTNYTNNKGTRRISNKCLTTQESNIPVMFYAATKIMLFSAMTYGFYQTLSIGVAIVG